jgi:hypothetical protein
VLWLGWSKLKDMVLKSSLFTVLLSAVLLGQNAPPPQGGDDQSNPEDRDHGVARISLMNGDVSVRRGDSGDVIAANINAPMLAGDSIQTGPASRAEVQFDFANRVRLSALSEVQMGDLRAGAIQIQIARGTATFTIIGDTQAQIEVSTPTASLRPLHRGAYRVSVLEDGTTQLTVRAGQADIYTQQGSRQLAAGQTMLLRGNPNDPEYQLVVAPARDEWDQFNETRDRELARSTAYQHVSRDVPGAEDLDQYGRWNNDPTYGDVWVPNVAADWAPYQSGRWLWEDYYGWTWVSYDPWGWAPYHYGRWYRGPVGWAWVPGPIYARYGYRPALVGFFGFGAGVGFGVGFGFANLGWVALAPFEALHPWWGRGVYGGGITSVNVVRNVNVYNTYRNARVTNGVMGMSAQQFQSGQFGHFVHPGAAQLQSAGAVHGQLPITPGTNNLRFNDRTTSVASRTAGSQQRFVSRGGFAPVRRQSFTQQRQAVQQGISPSRGVQEMGSSGRGSMGGNSNSSSSWQRFGTPSSGPARAPSSSSSSTNGWGRFGSPGGTASATANRGTTNSTPYGSTAPRGYSQPSGSTYSGSSARPVHIAPSVVQQRPSGGSSSAPANRPSAPAAPANHSGGTSSGHSSGGGHHGR